MENIFVIFLHFSTFCKEGMNNYSHYTFVSIIDYTSQNEHIRIIKYT